MLMKFRELVLTRIAFFCKMNEGWVVEEYVLPQEIKP